MNLAPFVDLSFDALNPFGFRATDTFAYWIGNAKQEQLDEHEYSFYPDIFDAGFMVGEMSFQFTIEDQASTADDVPSRPDWIPELFSPVGPVALAENWAPFSSATEMLGPPNRYSVYRFGSMSNLAVLLAWNEPEITERPFDGTVHEKHLSNLLKAAVARHGPSESVILVGQHGWSYESAVNDENREDRQKIWREYGYPISTRVPE